MLQVEWPDQSRQECLVPYASLMNHSIYPHVVRYSKLDPTSQCLNLPLFRPIAKDEQCFLSYGPLSNLNLMLFYGMTIPDNPYDMVPIDFTVSLGMPSQHLASPCCAAMLAGSACPHHVTLRLAHAGVLLCREANNHEMQLLIGQEAPSVGHVPSCYKQHCLGYVRYVKLARGTMHLLL